ncbi:restriction endonuclease subunit S [Gemmiger formicilis]|uniref:restriction endonuclease subunit S n=3 Tax=Gemmiger formicilis TaxID=745368 RepID=UPI00242C56E9|nr:restriction endonuclease subunit S [Gemmiger formicilis]
MAKQNKPAIRFKGFTDAWEQRKLGEVVKEVTRNDPTSEAPIMMITANNGFIEQSERYAFDNAGESLKKYILLQKGELAYNHGASKLRPFGSCFALTTAESARIPFVYHCFSAENKNAEFLSIELNGSEVESQLRKIVSSGARMDGLLNISFDEYSTVTVLLPDIKEQEHIADFFRNLDHLITLHQRKYDKLQVLKKAMLEKMFPKNGSSVPEIRFKGFTDAWEQRKLGEILQERNTRTSDFESNPLYSLTIESGVTPKTDRYERSSLVTKTEDLFKTVKPNEFVTNPMNLRFGALGYNKNAFTVSVSGYYDVFSIDDDKCSGFWNAYFKTPTAMNIFDNAATGSLIEKRRVKYSTLQQLAFYMPNDLSEKAEIGKYMDTFDHLITLHQRELEKLQNIKKSMLEKMFV